jgi:hypothetical protein
MRYFQTIGILALAWVITSCSNDQLDEKGVRVSQAEVNSDSDQADGLGNDSLKISTRPGSVLLTGVPNVRLTPVFKVNVNKKDNTTFTGSTSYHYSYDEIADSEGNNWNNHLMPGLEAVYGYNMVNVSHYSMQDNTQKLLFDRPVLIRTLYYPSYVQDTLNTLPVNRQYFIVSVYNEDTNKDGFINMKDLRRIYSFDINGENQRALVPEDYSVFKSEFDAGNDFMFLFAQLDMNKNGAQDDGEPTHIFWMDLNDPLRTGRLY